MIFVTVGTHATLGFERLISAVDDAAAQLDEPVIIQRGCAAYEPVHAEHFRFASSERIDALNRDARLIISHAAAGAIIFALRNRKPLIVVPRLQEFNEGIDNHQLELAEALAQQQRAVAIREPNAQNLLNAISVAPSLKRTGGEANQLIGALRDELSKWGNGSQRKRLVSQPNANS